MPSGLIKFTTGQVPTTAQWNGKISSQVVGYYASNAARSSDVTAPELGMVTNVAGRLEWYNGSSWEGLGPSLQASSSITVGTVNQMYATAYTLPPGDVLLKLLVYDDSGCETFCVNSARVRLLTAKNVGERTTTNRIKLEGILDMYVARDSSNQLLVAFAAVTTDPNPLEVWA